MDRSHCDRGGQLAMLDMVAMWTDVALIDNEVAQSIFGRSFMTKTVWRILCQIFLHVYVCMQLWHNLCIPARIIIQINLCVQGN